MGKSLDREVDDDGTATARKLEPQTYAVIPAQAMHDRHLRARDWRVLAAISFRADTKGIAWPSQDDLSTMTGLPRSRVNEAIQRLREFSYIEVTKVRRRAGKFPTNCYRVIRLKPFYHDPPVGGTVHDPPVGDITV